MAHKNNKKQKSTERIRNDIEYFKSIGETKMVKILKRCLDRIMNTEPNVDTYKKLMDKKLMDKKL